MKAYLVHPNVTLGNEKLANDFFDLLKMELDQHVLAPVIVTEEVIESTMLTKEDALVFFNRDDQYYSESILSLLSDTLGVEASILPIAISKNHRFPPEVVFDCQSYDIDEELRKRNLSIAQIETISTSFARTIVSFLQPTLTKNNFSLFLSYRRSDGEKVASLLYDELIQRSQSTFRDLNRVIVGEHAQEKIEYHLSRSDAVIFVDTPQSGESNWIKHELKTALRMNIPIVWIQMGSDHGRAALKIKPVDRPHFYFPSMDLEHPVFDPDMVDEIIKEAFRISRENAKKVFGSLRQIRLLDKFGVIKMKKLDKKKLIYQIEIERKGYRYFQRPMTHVAGFYGRIPQEDDSKDFQSIVNTWYKPHSEFGHLYDAALMLAPMVPQNSEFPIEEQFYKDSVDEYIRSLEQLVRSDQNFLGKKEWGVIISGAFPDCEPEYQQHLTNAVYTFTHEILSRRGTVIFGAHPTFQHLIMDMAKQIRPHDYRQAVHMYVSKYFVTEAKIEEFNKDFTIASTKKMETREKSLTLMREAMINNNQAVCMVVMGGKTNAGYSAGIDEEIELACSAGLPVFLVGSTGGRVSELTAKLSLNNWRGRPNDSSVSLNHELMVSSDYKMLANKIVQQLEL